MKPPKTLPQKTKLPTPPILLYSTRLLMVHSHSPKPISPVPNPHHFSMERSASIVLTPIQYLITLLHSVPTVRRIPTSLRRSTVVQSISSKTKHKPQKTKLKRPKTNPKSRPNKMRHKFLPRTFPNRQRKISLKIKRRTRQKRCRM